MWCEGFKIMNCLAEISQNLTCPHFPLFEIFAQMLSHLKRDLLRPFFALLRRRHNDLSTFTKIHLILSKPFKDKAECELKKVMRHKNRKGEV